MEQRAFGHWFLAVIFCAASAAFAYSVGHQAGERDAQEALDRSATERRLASIVNRDQELYMGDYAFPMEGDYESTLQSPVEHPVQTCPTNRPEGAGHMAADRDVVEPAVADEATDPVQTTRPLP
ncbi:hypothetical protein [Humisphaera borealis]|uniref:Secreted protein n=1 Tax=Humisphaera borealis TaxID=2807512 RepID=A0A7M2WT42_9BACT|nr:hypothetical protein [Humisphaera borealis]QOV88695.1 hypothetical protein IPV69_21040 [Humisphaera borealis]